MHFMCKNSTVKNKSLFLILLVLASLCQSKVADAATTLKVTYKVNADIGYDDVNPDFYSVTQIVGSSQAAIEKKKMEAFAKASSTKAKLTSICKSMDSYNARVKVTDARGGTAGLGNLKSVAVSGIKSVENLANLPDYTDEEQEALEEKYSLYSDYPDYIEEGYVYYSVEATCLFSGSVSLISSNAYRVFINGSTGPEYSRAELAKMKWTITLVDN